MHDNVNELDAGKAYTKQCLYYAFYIHLLFTYVLPQEKKKISALYCINVMLQSKSKSEVNKMLHFHLISRATRKFALISDKFTQRGQAVAEILTVISQQIVEHCCK